MTECTTGTIRIRVQPRFHPERSRPSENHWFFSYTVEIANEGDDEVQLLARRWRIHDATGNVEEVEGPGVVGQTPTLRPGTAFRYTSFCPLPTSLGAMEGTYTLRREDGTLFDAQVAPFTLVDPTTVN